MKLTRQILAVLAVFVMTAMGLANAAERITFVHNDVLGSPVAATNETGDVLWRATFQPYGERNGGGGFEEEVAYTGQIEDKEIGLIDYGARTYDPAIGRFLSIDPFGFEESNFPSFNRYSYANNSPYRYVDPDGRAIETVLIDIPSLIISAGLFAQAPGFANGVGLLIDLGATLIPGVPGGVGLARQAGKVADVAKSSVQANKAAGDAARDAIAARTGGVIEQNFRTTGGLRRVDVLDSTTAIESKVGRTGLTKRVRQELARDVKLLRSGQVDRVQYEFTRSAVTGKAGPTGPLRSKLEKFGIDIVE